MVDLEHLAQECRSLTDRTGTRGPRPPSSPSCSSRPRSSHLRSRVSPCSPWWRCFRRWPGSSTRTKTSRSSPVAPMARTDDHRCNGRAPLAHVRRCRRTAGRVEADLYRRIWAGDLPAIKLVGIGVLRIASDDLDDFLRRSVIGSSTAGGAGFCHPAPPPTSRSPSDGDFSVECHAARRAHRADPAGADRWAEFDEAVRGSSGSPARRRRPRQP